MSPKTGVIDYKTAHKIHLQERDVSLGLNSSSWPKLTPQLAELGWELGPGNDHLHREIVEDEQKLLAGPLIESLLRFPSASLNGLQRRQEYHVNVNESENLHTYRVLSHPQRGQGKVRRIFLLHNGLNEADSMGLYYQLASHLFAAHPEHRSTVCIIRPFPGHLTRSPFQAFAETPLDRYLWDGSHLFRQFVRYMIETQWFLSTIVRRSQYRCSSGAHLLAESADQDESRLRTTILANAMETAWAGMYDKATAAVEEDRKDNQPDSVMPKAKLRSDHFRRSIDSLRNLLHLDKYRELGGENITKAQQEPELHVIGYSLGGFTAQSVFMSWPFLIGSCSTLLSGGPLRELAPTAFANPEEWQTVLHSLRYELDDAMMSGRFGRSGEDVAGIERDLFSYFTRTFYEVFQQEYRGSFRTRLAAFRQRMLFVVGGNDPIVRPSSVLDSAPAGGINMFEIAALGHFLAAETKDPEEIKLRAFWLPKIASLIDRLSDRAAEELCEERVATWLGGKAQRAVSKAKKAPEFLTAQERLTVERDGSLPGALFERCLDDLLARQSSRESSALLVLRNEVPTMLLDFDSIRERATTLSHNDAGIAAYMQGVLGRKQCFSNQPNPHLGVILPWNIDLIMKSIDRHPGFPTQAESSGGLMETRPDPLQTWSLCADICHGLSRQNPNLVGIFDWQPQLSSAESEGPELEILRDLATKENYGEPLQFVPSIPDCWVWMSTEFLMLGKDTKLTIELTRARLPDVIRHYSLKENDGRLEEMLRRDELRIVSVSRARYNPRFRGRIVASAGTARRTLIHVALCLAASHPFSDYFGADGQRSDRPGS
jgi:pimeloyl-ACP methyl ester carboxylesterase